MTDDSLTLRPNGRRPQIQWHKRVGIVDLAAREAGVAEAGDGEDAPGRRLDKDGTCCLDNGRELGEGGALGAEAVARGQQREERI